MKTPKFIEVIWISIQFGLSNKKGSTWGIILQIYTAFWILWTLVFTIGVIFSDAEGGFIINLIVLSVLILPPYLPIYLVWESNDKKQNKELIKIDTQKPMNKIMESSAKKAWNQTTEIKSGEAPTNTPNFSKQTKNIIKSMDNILQNENIIDAISGSKRIDKKSDMSPSALVLTSSRISLHHKKNIRQMRN